jgi:transposase
MELQVDFGLMGRVEWDGVKRDLHALIFTSVFSRHVFVWLTHTQTTEAVLTGFEEAWRYFGGIFHVVIPDNCKAIVGHADSCGARLTTEFMEYAQCRVLRLTLPG